LSFEDRSQRVARNFLQSAVVFDDEAFFPTSGTADAPDAQEDNSPETDEDGDGSAEPQLLVEPAPVEQVDHEFGVNAKELGDAFARLGLICGFLKPSGAASAEDRKLVIEAARRADVVILDWSIKGDLGGPTSEIVEAILTADENEEERRLRLIAIYTSRLETGAILDRLEEIANKFFDDSPMERSDFSLAKGPLRVELYAKVTAHVVGKAAEARAVSERELPKKLLDDFAAMNMELVSLVALAGLAAIRADTHRVLGVLKDNLDAGYIAQRLLLPDKEEAGEQLVELVTAELRAIMDDRGVGEEAGAAAIKEWLRWKVADGEPLGIIDAEGQEEEDLDVLLKYGLSSGDNELSEVRHRLGLTRATRTDKAAALFAPDDAAGSRANDRFAMQLTLRSHYKKPPRVLQLGTLVRDANDKYALCVQPVCDSVRLGEHEKRDFLFVPAEPDNEKFDLVVHDPEDGARRTLKLATRPYLIRKIAFSPSGSSGCVKAVEGAGIHTFSDAESVPYTWIASLKEGYAQRIAQGLGTEFSRIGLSESEWLRIKAKGKS
jgi:hypothetical protein